MLGLIKREIDGFILNRLQGALLSEAMRLVGEGYVSPEDLERRLRGGWRSLSAMGRHPREANSSPFDTNRPKAHDRRCCTTQDDGPLQTTAAAVGIDPEDDLDPFPCDQREQGHHAT